MDAKTGAAVGFAAALGVAGGALTGWVMAELIRIKNPSPVANYGALVGGLMGAFVGGAMIVVAPSTTATTTTTPALPAA
jgi:hypothetical protein